MSSDNEKGLALAVSSSLFIGASFIIKKKGLKRAGASGVRAGGSLIFLCFGILPDFFFHGQDGDWGWIRECELELDIAMKSFRY